MQIEASVSGQPQVSASVSETTISVSPAGTTRVDVSVSGGIGPTGPAGTTSWNGIVDKPASFNPSSHAATHAVGGVDHVSPVSIGAATIAAAESLQLQVDGKAANSHTHAASAIVSGTISSARLPAATAAAAGAIVVGSGLSVSSGVVSVSWGTGSTNSCRGDDARLSDSREWSAATVTQADAEAGVATDRKAFTVQRVWQAIAAWWAGSAAKTKLDGIAAGATANQTDAYLLSRSNHTGTQTASTISDFTSAVVAAAPPTTDASLLTTGTLPDQRLSANIARTSDVSSAISSLVDSAPGALDTLNELAAALGDDANFSTTVTNALAAKAPLASPTFTGTVSGITKSMVGLGNVDNTSDANKPVSTAQAAADSAVASAAAADATSKANAAQAAAVQRANHTGTQAISTVSGLQDALDGKQAAGSYAALVHTHAIADVTGLQTALDGKQASGSYAAASHTHDASAITTGTLNASRLPASVVQRVGSANAVSVGPITSLYPIAPEDVTEISVLSIAVWDGNAYETVFEVRGDGLLTFGAIDFENVINAPATYAPIAHKASHATGGTDALSPADIGAAAISHSHSAGDIVSGTLSASRLPIAAAGTLGAVRIGSGISIDGNGVISVSTNYAAASHTHSAADITSGTLNASRLPAAIYCQFVGLDPNGIPEAPGDYQLLTGSDGVDTTFALYADGRISCAAITLAGTDLASTLSGKADAADFDQGVKTTDAPTFGNLTLTGNALSQLEVGYTFYPGGYLCYDQAGAYNVLIQSYGDFPSSGGAQINVSGDVGTLKINADGIRFADASVQTTAGAALSHTHDAADVTVTYANAYATVSFALSGGDIPSFLYGLSEGDYGHIFDLFSPTFDNYYARLESDPQFNLCTVATLKFSDDTTQTTAAKVSKSFAKFTPADNNPPATNFATLDTRNSVLVLEFDAATDESAVFVGYIPEGVTLTNGLKVRISWMADTATSGNVRWGVQFEETGTDLDADSFDTATLVTSAANGTSGIETVATITATSIDSLAAGDRFRLKVYRDADDATNDTMTGDAQLVAVEVQVA